MAKTVEPARQVDALAAPRAIFEDAKKRAVRGNKAANLDLLWEVLIEIREEGGRDYSLAEVGRRLEQKGGLKTQSLRNTGGADFRVIITAFAQSVMGSPRYIAKTKSSVDQALELISDHSTRVVLQEELVKAKKLREENATLRHAFSRLSIPTVEERPGEARVNEPTHMPTLSQKGAEAGMVVMNERGRVVSEDLLEALQKGLNRRRLLNKGFKVLEDGSIRGSVNNEQLFPPGFVTACEAFLAGYGRKPE